MITAASFPIHSTIDRFVNWVSRTPLVDTGRLRDGTPVLLSPLGAHEADVLQNFVRTLSVESRYRRFFSTLSELTPAMLERATQRDDRQHLGLLAKTVVNGVVSVIGWAEYGVDSDGQQGEIGLVVGDAWQGRGVGRHLMETLIARATDAGLTRLHGTVLATNDAMLQLAHTLGFTVQASREGAAYREVRLLLNQPVSTRKGVLSSYWQKAAITA